MIKIDPIRKELILKAIQMKYGYDFHDYSEASIERRLSSLTTQLKMEDPLDLIKILLESQEKFRELLPFLTVSTTEFFRDPEFFKCLRQEVLPVLATYPSLRIWCAGCSTGQEVLSLCILLDEVGLLKKSTIYATDINPKNLKISERGIYPISSLKTFAKNYVKAGGTRSPSDYYTVSYDFAKFDDELLENVVFSEHNLATDNAFLEAHLILCRNVLIYFNKSLQKRCFSLFLNSLRHGGFLGIGSKETLRFSGTDHYYQPVDTHLNVYRKSFDVSYQNIVGEQ